MLTYMLDTNTCIYVMKNYPLDLREKFNALAEQLCISTITRGEASHQRIVTTTLPFARPVSR